MSNVERAGPWISASRVRDILLINEAELTRRLENREILGCEFRSGNWFYPSRQFMDAAVPPGLKEVLDTLAEGESDPETWALWLAGSSQDGISNWDLLRAGRLQLVLEAARRDASRWKQ